MENFSKTGKFQSFYLSNFMKINIIIFGFSGSGKSTIAKLLGKELGMRVIHPSSILKELIQGETLGLNNSKAGTGFWESDEGIQLFKNRLEEKQPIDFVCDDILLKELEEGNIVMDSWTMPWIAKSGLKVYLKANKKIRINRVAKRSNISKHLANQVITMKDNETRNLYIKHKGFDIKKDLHVFDLIINTDNSSPKEIGVKILESI